MASGEEGENYSAVNGAFEDNRLDVVVHMGSVDVGISTLEHSDNLECGILKGAKADGPSKEDEMSPSAFAFLFSRVERFFNKYQKLFKVLRIVVIILALLAYLTAALCIQLSKINDIDWCGGVGFLIVIAVLAAIGLFYSKVLKLLFTKLINKKYPLQLRRNIAKIWSFRFTPGIFVVLLVASVLAFLIVDTVDQRERLRSALGVVVLLALGLAFSKHPRKVRWRHVCWGLGLQYVFGLIALRWPVGKNALECMGEKVSRFLDFSDVGASFVYNHLVDGQTLTAEVSSSSHNFTATVKLTPDQISPVFAFKVLAVVFFFNFSIQILYYYGIMQWVVMKLGWLLSATIGTTAAESMSTAANIFLAQTEAPLVIKPYLPVMTRSELHAVMSGGFATVAGSVLAAYINYGIEATHLIAASVMAAPASLAFSKLLYPETEVSKTTTKDIKMEKSTEANALDAAAQGAASAVMVVLNICASLIAFLSFIAFVNAVFEWLFLLVGAEGITFVWIVTKIFTPLVWCLGVDPSECELVAEVIATKNVVNEFAGFSKLGQMKLDNLISRRAEGIATFAMCGFANPGSIGIQLAVIATMAPSRKGDLAQIAIRAFASGSATSLLNACVAGMLLREPGPLAIT